MGGWWRRRKAEAAAAAEIPLNFPRFVQESRGMSPTRRCENVENSALLPLMMD